MKAEEVRELSEELLEEKISEAKTELFNLRFQLVTGQLDNPHRLKEIRRDIARLMTMQRERELDILPESGKPNKGVKKQTKSVKTKEVKEGKRFFKKRGKEADQSHVANRKSQVAEGKDKPTVGKG